MHYTYRLKKLNRIVTKFAIIRLALFFTLAFVLWSNFYWGASWIRIGAIMASIAAFNFAVRKYKAYQKWATMYEQIIKFEQQQEARKNREFSNSDLEQKQIDTQHPFSYDMDLFGSNSLFEFINSTLVPNSQIQFAKELTELNYSENMITEEQHATAELEKRYSVVLKFLNFDFNTKALNQEELSHFQSSEILKAHKPFVKQILYLTTPLLWLFVILYAFDFLSFHLALLFFFIQGGIDLYLRKRTMLTKKEFDRISQFVTALYKLSNFISKQKFKTDKLVNIQNDLSKKISDLKAISDKFQLYTAIESSMLGGFINPFFPFSFFLKLNYTAKWQLVKNEINHSLNNIVNFDILCSKAVFYHNNLHYQFPKLQRDTILNSNNLGHPLLNPKSLVSNDFNLEKGKIFILTGANMSGKSTFIRSIAVNHILAMNGMPVCANSYEFSPSSLFSVMRTLDALTKNESYFLSEVKRVKEMFAAIEKSPSTIVMIDELLKGTNSADRISASQKVIRKLLQLNATGIIATHDLELCELEKEFADKIVNICFEVEFDNEQMYIDYKLRKAVTTNMNASYLVDKYILNS